MYFLETVRYNKCKVLYQVEYFLFSELQEQVMVVPSDLVYQFGRWQGLWLDFKPTLLDIIQNKYSFLPRSQVEQDTSWQQIIPYQVFTTGTHYYVGQKLAGSSERRLHYKYMLGVGGHINPQDAGNGNILEAGIQREWSEEIAYQGKLQRTLIGLLKDHNNAVSQVHLALVYLVRGSSDYIHTIEPEKMQGKLYSLTEIGQLYDELDSWGQIVYQYLLGRDCIFQWV